MALSLFKGRKFLGPLDIAQINATKSREKFIKTAVLTEIISEMELIDEQINDESVPQHEKVLLRLLKSQLNSQLCDFLGVPNDEDGASEDS